MNNSQIRHQNESLVQTYLEQAKSNIVHKTEEVEEVTNKLVYGNELQNFVKRYATNYFDYPNANIQFQFQCVPIIREIMSHSSSIIGVNLHFAHDHFYVTQHTFSHKKEPVVPKKSVGTDKKIGWIIDEDPRYQVILNSQSDKLAGDTWAEIVVDKEIVFQALGEKGTKTREIELFLTNDRDAVKVINNQYQLIHEHPSKEVEVEGEKDLYLRKEEDITNHWRLIGKMKQDNYWQQLRIYLAENFWIMIVPLILFCLAIIPIIDKFLRPLKILVEAMETVQNGSLDVVVEEQSKDEFGLLTRTFNFMITTIKQQILDIKQTEKKKRQAEIKIFQAQIKPHFLYNSLATISWSARKDGAFELEKISNSLASFYRLVLGKGKVFTQVATELETIRYYLEIQAFRFSDTLSVEIKINCQIDNYYILRNVLQPIVENGIEHGIFPKGEGKILINIEEYQDYLMFMVFDSGIGMSQKDISIILNEAEFTGDYGFSLIGIRDALKYCYGQEVKIEIFSVINEGTLVTIAINKTSLLNPQ